MCWFFPLFFSQAMWHVGSVFQPGIELMLPAPEACSLNQGTTREVSAGPASFLREKAPDLETQRLLWPSIQTLEGTWEAGLVHQSLCKPAVA